MSPKIPKIAETSISVPFHVSNMFSDIPPNQCQFLLIDLLNKSQSCTLKRNDLLEDLNSCICQNYRQYNQHFCSQNTSLPLYDPPPQVYKSNVFIHICLSELCHY